jgi:hypothetical protein
MQLRNGALKKYYYAGPAVFLGQSYIMSQPDTQVTRKRAVFITPPQSLI